MLNDELAVLRSVSSSPSANFKLNGKESQVDQLTLSLRTLNEKISATESVLARRTQELTYTQAELMKQKLATDAAYELASRIRAREEGINELRREMEWKWRIEEEKVRMCERTVGEYADLVRTLEGRGRSGSGSSQISLVHDNDTTTSSKETMERLSREQEDLQSELSSTQHELAILTSQYDAQSKVLESALEEVALLRSKLELVERDDTTAAKMVSRYMYVLSPTKTLL